MNGPESVFFNIFVTVTTYVFPTDRVPDRVLCVLQKRLERIK